MSWQLIPAQDYGLRTWYHRSLIVFQITSSAKDSTLTAFERFFWYKEMKWCVIHLHIQVSDVCIHLLVVNKCIHSVTLYMLLATSLVRKSAEFVKRIYMKYKHIFNLHCHKIWVVHVNHHVYISTSLITVAQHCTHACRHAVPTCLWTANENLRSAEWRLPHGAFCLHLFKNNRQLTAPLCPPSRPFIWQPHLFPLCWLIADLLPFSRKHELEIWEGL